MISQYATRAGRLRIVLLVFVVLICVATLWDPGDLLKRHWVDGNIQWSRVFLAFAIAAMGIGAIARPDYFFGVTGFFCGAAKRLPASEKERLERALVARQGAERISSRANGGYFAAAALATAVLELLPGIPPAVPYALFSLALAFITLLAYLQFRRANDRRFAPLVRRSVLASLPLPVIIAMGCTFVGELAFAMYPRERLGAIVIAFATAILATTAWRVAIAPALLLGSDPQVEYVVDERLRKGRALSIAILACGVGSLFVSYGILGIPDQYGYLRVAELVVSYATLVPLTSNLLVLRQRIAFA
jgi:hypothetical protein